jgi:NAD(P)-dependent dehydrogenase (short-subunit alcohol dehydrogenase family)
VNDAVLDFAKQIVIVTGGATGIGESCARLFARRGASVTVMDIDGAGAERVTAAIGDEGGDAHASIVDLTDWNATRAAVAQCHQRAGRIDILVHSAGGFPHYVNLITRITWRGSRALLQSLDARLRASLTRTRC